MLLQRRTTNHEMPTISYPIPQQDLSSPFPVDPLPSATPRPFSPGPQSTYPSPVSPQSSTRRLPTRQMSPKPRANWLRGSSSHSHSKSETAASPRGHGYSASLSSPSPKPSIRISEPKFLQALDIFSGHRDRDRVGALGSGATVVRTPQEALAGTAVASFREEDEDEALRRQNADGDSMRGPESPPLPPLPISKSPSAEQSFDSQRQGPPKPTRPPPPPPALTLDISTSSISIYPPTPDHQLVARQPSPPLSASCVRSSGQSFTSSQLPPFDLSLPAVQAPFDAVLLSSVPSPVADPRKVVITLETSTSSFKATLHTLASRPSHLATFLTGVLNPDTQAAAEEEAEEDQASLYSKNSGSQLAPPTPGSTTGAFNSLFHSHLANAGLIPTSSSSLHVFFDRSSAPYAHILSYLRTPTSSQGALPRALYLLPTSFARIDALLELRDEASYLGLEELERLCTEELVLIQQQFQQLSTAARHHKHARDMSTSSARTAFHSDTAAPHVRTEHGRGRGAKDANTHSAGSLSSTETHVSSGAVALAGRDIPASLDTRSTRSASPGPRTSVLGEIGVFQNTKNRVTASGRSRSCSSARSGRSGLEYPMKPPGSNAF